MSNYVDSETTPVLVYLTGPEHERLQAVSKELEGEPLDRMLIRLAFLAIEFKEMAEEARKATHIADTLLKANAEMHFALVLVERWMRAEIDSTAPPATRMSLATEAMKAVIQAQEVFRRGVE